MVLILYVAGALAIIGMAGLALDLGMSYVTKTRLQNAVDAAALAGARTLVNNPLGVVAASNSAKSAFTLNTANIAVTADDLSIETSATLPFPGLPVPAKYVKVVVQNVPVTTYLINVLSGGTSVPISASAIAGPQPVGDGCGAPIGICAVDRFADPTCGDANGCYGLGIGEITLKGDQFAPGNFGLLDAGSGASGVNDGLAGAQNMCFQPGTSEDTEPGLVGSNKDALNSRFGTANGKYNKPALYPSDTKTGIASWLSYVAYLAAPADHAGVLGRRTLLVPIIDCTCGGGGCGAGKTSVPILGASCVLLTRPVTQDPVTSPTGTVYIQLIDQCLASGGTPGGSGSGGAVRIVLYQASDQS